MSAFKKTVNCIFDNYRKDVTRPLVRHHNVKYATELGMGPIQPNEKGNVSHGETKRKSRICMPFVSSGSEGPIPGV
jgi:hypothetical protein